MSSHVPLHRSTNACASAGTSSQTATTRVFGIIARAEACEYGSRWRPPVSEGLTGPLAMFVRPIMAQRYVFTAFPFLHSAHTGALVLVAMSIPVCPEGARTTLC